MMTIDVMHNGGVPQKIKGAVELLGRVKAAAAWSERLFTANQCAP